MKQDGFQVIPLLPKQVLLTVRKREDIQGVVLCHSIDVNERVELAQQLREVSPTIAVVIMRRPNEEFHASNLTSVVECLPRPELLVAAVRGALKEQQPLGFLHGAISLCQGERRPAYNGTVFTRRYRELQLNVRKAPRDVRYAMSASETRG